MNESDRWEDLFIDFDAYLPKPHRIPALVEAVSPLFGMVAFVVLAGIVLRRR